MDAELTKTITACVALGLGLIIISLLTRRVFLHSSNLSVTINNATIRAIEAGIFDVQIDLDIYAKGGDIYLKELSLSHPVGIFDPDKGDGERAINRLIGNLGYSVLDQEEKTFSDTMKALQNESFDAIGLKFADKEHRRISIVDRLMVNPSKDDGYWNWPMEGWTLSFLTSVGSIKVPLLFSIHESSRVNAFCINYGPARATTWSC